MQIDGWLNVDTRASLTAGIGLRSSEKNYHDDVIKWKYFPLNWPFVRELPSQRPVTRSSGVSFDLRLNKRLRKQSWGWWFEKLLYPLWRHCNDSTEIPLNLMNYTSVLCLQEWRRAINQIELNLRIYQYRYSVMPNHIYTAMTPNWQLINH